ncbi:MAG: tetratricopeptide repeat protein [Candidatus Riflebacteria bacterium]|nr:tetratricopeptide repeat protein [Candidatus Riflebacteria bacterium]
MKFFFNTALFLFVALIFVLCGKSQVIAEDSYETLLETVRTNFAKKEFAKALPEALKIVPLSEAQFGKKSEEFISIHRTIGHIYLNLKDYPKAEIFFERALELRKETFVKTDNISVAQFVDGITDLAGVCSAQKRVPEAEKLYKEAVDVSVNKPGDPCETHCGCIDRLGLFYQDQGRFQEAERYLLQSLEKRKQFNEKLNVFFYGSDHSKYNKHSREGTSYVLMADLYLRMGKIAEAETAIKTYCEIYETSKEYPLPEEIDSVKKNIMKYSEAKKSGDASRPLMDRLEKMIASKKE